ncbi:ADP,ATP carrier protein [Grifola frondosa]|uniref:ADP/ATP translocase n=1 Tax=Grifola frondosa TaxID=5627 RepID=A0A1C7LK65_GRIFR|nr:ADP,ATP carrier protein [Grifola frondosa]
MATTSKETAPKSHFFVDFMMGGTAAAISKTVAAPIERVKLLMQNQGAMLGAGRLDRPYLGMADCFKRTYADEGFRSFWRGNGTNIIRYFPTQALNFAFKDSFKQMFGFKKSEGFGLWVFVERPLGLPLPSSSTPSISGHLTSPMLTETHCVGSPTISVTKGGQRQFSGLIDVYKQTLKSDGVIGLYRGFVPSVVGICVYRGFYFGGYDTVKDTLLIGPLRGNFLAALAAGWGAALAAYPLDTVRRRMMMTSGESVHYKSFIDAGRQIVAKEGAKSLFGGAGANVIRGIASAGVLALYDQFQELAFGTVYVAGSG